MTCPGCHVHSLVRSLVHSSDDKGFTYSVLPSLLVGLDNDKQMTRGTTTATGDEIRTYYEGIRLAHIFHHYSLHLMPLKSLNCTEVAY